MAATAGALPPLGSVPAIDRLRDAKRRFATFESYSASAPSAEPRPAALRLSAPRQRGCSTSSSPPYAAATVAGGQQEGVRGSMPHVSGLSSIRRHSVGDSETNSVLTWTLLSPNCRNSPRGVAPTASSSSGVVGSEEAEGNSPPAATATSSGGTGSSGVGGAVSTATLRQHEHRVGTMEAHDFYRRRYEAQRIEVAREEEECRRRRDACSAAVTRFISHSTRLASVMELQRRIYDEVMQRPLETFASTEPALTPAAGPPRRSKLSHLFLPAGRESEGVPGASAPVTGGAQVALRMLKSSFASGRPPSTGTSSKPQCGQATTPGLEAAAPAAGELPSEATILSAEEVPLDGKEKSRNNDDSARKRSSSAEEVLAVPPPAEHGEPKSVYPSLVTETATASTAIYDSRIRYTREQNEEERALSPDSQPRASGRAALTEEEQRGLRLLSTVRELRRQAEELTIAVLNAVGKRGSESTGASVFRGLFLPPITAMRLLRAEEEMGLRLARLAASEEAEAGGLRPVTAALRQQHPFRRSIPPPPPVSVQLETFHLPGTRLRRGPDQYQRREQQQQQRQQEKAVSDNSRAAVRPPGTRHAIDATEEDAREHGGQRPQRSATSGGHEARLGGALVDGEASSQLAAATKEGRMGEQQKSQSLLPELHLRRFCLDISSSSSPGSLSSSYTGPESSTAGRSHADRTASSTSLTLFSSDMTTTLEARTGEDANTTAVLRGSTTGRKGEAAAESEGANGKDGLFPAFHQGGLSLEPGGSTTARLPGNFTSSSVAPRVADDFTDAAYVPIFHAEEVCNKSKKDGNKARKVAKRVLSFFSFGGCCGGGGGSATADGRRRDNAALLSEREARR
ncbi:uncharacterized protein Tco025E_02323 [Trypanosoma conorhini]|uniref:Uncharacterized protein n=1 Tax=Trypanosoma conorhini TaxID=83891 RepID=A0A3R7NPQ5_9TRYP|nr:uncharacterized protein Tco025E_02323 [Trypanosoma conorhini]RNF25129.1 hypothetical protein Tco025E_02323 [Trypanosoma conorhini]